MITLLAAESSRPKNNFHWR